MYLDPNRLIRGSVLAQQVSRGATVGAPKSGFGQKLTSAPALLVSLDGVHQKIRAATSAAQLADLLDEYVGLAALLAGTYATAAPFIPGGGVLSAAISGMSRLPGSAGG